MPYPALIGFAYNSAGMFPILHRGNNVRSAKNLWSLVSGLHETGLTLAQQFANECREEVNLEIIPSTFHVFGCYDEILEENGQKWHWLMILCSAQVVSLGTLKNVEPEKHDELMLTILNGNFFKNYVGKMSPATSEFIYSKSPEIVRHITNNNGR